MPHVAAKIFRIAVDEQLRQAARQQEYTAEVCLIELLADKEADKERIPDAGELEGSSDNFDGWLIWKP